MSHDIQPSQAWMVVYVASNQPDAYIVVGRLESEGIRSWISQEPIGSAYGLIAGSLGDVKVVVNAPDYDRAKEILSITYTYDEADDEFEEDDGAPELPDETDA